MKRSTSRARIKWVMQTGAPERNGGCGIAALAMILGTDYNRIREMAPELCEKCGISDDFVLDQFLSEHGFAVQRKWKWVEYNNSQTEVWPPKPWAPVHLCSVVQEVVDVYGHYVIMDAKGRVFDPADEEETKHTLADYAEIDWIAGIWAVNA